MQQLQQCIFSLPNLLNTIYSPYDACQHWQRICVEVSEASRDWGLTASRIWLFMSIWHQCQLSWRLPSCCWHVASFLLAYVPTCICVSLYVNICTYAHRWLMVGYWGRNGKNSFVNIDACVKLFCISRCCCCHVCV